MPVKAYRGGPWWKLLALPLPSAPVGNDFIIVLRLSLVNALAKLKLSSCHPVLLGKPEEMTAPNLPS